MEFKDYYEILGVTEKSTPDEIKKAYRKLARKYHPDVSKEENAEQHFKEVSEAYEVLKDPEKKSEYDQLRSMGARGAQGDFRPPPGWESSAHFSDGGFTQADASQFSDFFESIFGGGMSSGMGGGFSRRHQGFSMRGDDAQVKLPLFLEEAFHGCQKTIQLAVPEINKQGQVTKRAKSLNVKIPKGAYHGQKIRLRGQGSPGHGDAEHGDLFIEIEIAPHPVFEVKQRDLYLQLPVTPSEAALGASVEVPLPTGTARLKVPANSQAGKRLRLKGKGLPGSPAGDLIVTLSIQIPPATSPEARTLYEQLAKAENFDPRSALRQRMRNMQGESV